MLYRIQMQYTLFLMAHLKEISHWHSKLLVLYYAAIYMHTNSIYYYCINFSLALYYRLVITMHILLANTIYMHTAAI